MLHEFKNFFKFISIYLRARLREREGEGGRVPLSAAPLLGLDKAGSQKVSPPLPGGPQEPAASQHTLSRRLASAGHPGIEPRHS